MIVALIGMAMGLFAIRNMSLMDAADTRLYQEETIGLSLVKEANLKRFAAAIGITDAILATTEAERDKALSVAQAARESSYELLNKAGSLTHDGERVQAFEQVKKMWQADQAIVNEMFKRVQQTAQDQDEVLLQFLREQVVPSSRQIGQAMTELSIRFEEHARETAAENTELYMESRNITLALVVLGMIVGVVLGVVISRQVTRPLGQALEGAQRMEHGDMTYVLHAKGSDEIAQLIQAQEKMRQSLQRIVSSVREASQSVSAASHQIAQGNQDLSSRTVNQASSFRSSLCPALIRWAQGFLTQSVLFCVGIVLTLLLSQQRYSSWLLIG